MAAKNGILRILRTGKGISVWEATKQKKDGER